MSRWIAKLIVKLLNRVSIIKLLVNRLNLSDAELVSLRTQDVIRAFIIILSAWEAWQVLNSHADISDFIVSAWLLITNFLQFPAVTFVLNLALIGVETYLLFKVFGWVKTWFNAISNRVEAEKGNRLKGFKLQRVQIFTAAQFTSFLLAVNQYARYAVNILLTLIYLTGVFSIFPQTRGFVTNILTGVLQSLENGWQGFVDYLPNLLSLIVIIVMTYYGLKIIRFFFDEIEKGTITLSGFYTEWATPTYQLLRFVVLAFALVVAFPYLPGSSSPAFQGVSVFVGVLFSLGSSTIVANIISGIVLTYTRAFDVGDRVKIADTVGDIIAKEMLVTRIRTIKNVEITIPNSMVMGSHIINYSAISEENGLILNTTVTLGYDIPWRLIHETLIKAAKSTNGILAEPRPFVLQTSLDDFYVSYQLNAYSDEPNRQPKIYSDLHQNIQDVFFEQDIEILSPHYRAARDGNMTTIPANYLPKDYVA
ncbi:MAG: mechanosensitive ion channel family protein, partial [Anaerolineales bacterium]|nr:mechanosensitive ion channel family protein [Anaerolineales bacterium]